VAASPGELTYDLAVDASGAGQPSRVAAGLAPVPTGRSATGGGVPSGALLLVIGGGGLAAVAVAARFVSRRRSPDGSPVG
jgi:hypothetical protein